MAGGFEWKVEKERDRTFTIDLPAETEADSQQPVSDD
jgi:hypothetical protein